MVTFQQIADAIRHRAQGRYEVISAETSELNLPVVEYNSDVYRLKRYSINEAGWRTVLVIELPLSSLQTAFRWAADTRDVLPEPETADLYMFLIISGISHEEASRIETDDRFCRKVVFRQSEEIMDFLDRTFLAALDPAGDTEKMSNPLESAFDALSNALPWTSKHIPFWKEQLLSTKNGSDIARDLKESTNYNEDLQ
ncbi:MAG: ABC-three component system middle component 1 [Hafnia alvei]|uniref:ABC-three component system middle component 1 n=1 Tax=Hafnia alvei TaxID=569 RepID=UPI002911EB98|nr:ABC-three component system middle component 1 [Hafnia alvei]MDU7481582.1 ABC-three component system middle component 1 [Hafnia alvei]